LGGLGGFILGLLFYNAFMREVEQGAKWVLYLTCGLFTLFVGFLTVVISDHVTIWVTSFIGSYAIIRAISILVGRYPNEFTLAD